MGEKKEVILVPWDFTETSEIALQHAINLAKKVDNQVVLLHVLKKGGLFANKKKQKEQKEELEKQFKGLVQEFFMKYTFKPKFRIAYGNLIKTTAQVAKEMKANVIVIGTSGKMKDSSMKPKGFLKLNIMSNTPVIVTKHKPARSYYIEVVFPIDHDKKNKDKVQWALTLARYFQCNINIIKPYSISELDKKSLNNNIFFAKKTFDNKGVVYGTKTAKKNKNYYTSIYEFSQKIDADLILAMSYTLKKFVDKEKDEYTIPLMIVSPRTDLRKVGKFN